MGEIGKGDWVECVDASCRGYGDWEPGAQPVEGALYTVEDVFDGLDGPTIDLREIKRGPLALMFWGRRVGYGVDRFRPIYRPKSELIESLKAPPQRVSEHA